MSAASDALADALYDKWVDEPFRNIRASFREVAAAAERAGAEKGWDEGYERCAESSPYTDNPYRDKESE